MFSQLSLISKPLVAAILSILFALWKKGRRLKKALTSGTSITDLKKSAAPEIKEQCIIQWVGGRGCLTSCALEGKVEKPQVVGSANVEQAVHWVGGCGKLSEPTFKEQRVVQGEGVSEQCVVQWIGGRGCLTKVTIPDKVEEAPHEIGSSRPQTIQWVGARGRLTDVADEEHHQHVLSTPRAKQPSYQLPTPEKVEKISNMFVNIDVKASYKEGLEYNDLALGEIVRYSDGQEGVVEDFDNDGDVKVRKRDGASTIWYASKCSKAEVQIGDFVEYSCGTRARVHSFDPDGDIVVRKSSGAESTWYKHKTSAPVRGSVVSPRVCGM